MFFSTIFARFFKSKRHHIIEIMNKMKKLFLLVAVVTTISLGACNNSKSTETTEEIAPEVTELTLEETPVESVEVDSTITVVEVAEDTVVESLN